MGFGLFGSVSVPLAVLLFLLAVLGHFFLTVYSHNWWYGLPLQRHVTDVVQLGHGGLVLAGPVLFWLAAGLDLTLLFEWHSETTLWQKAASGYVLLCWLTAGVIFPWITIRRLRRKPLCLISEEVRKVDVAEQLGYRPVGRGKYRSLASLPRNEIFQVALTERTLLLSQIPREWDGLTILHISDLHFCGSPDKAYHQSVMELCREWQPDLIALTGDYVDSLFHHRWVVPVLGRLQSEIATLAILGNHDLWYEPERLRRRLRNKLQMHVLTHQWETIEVRGHSLIVVGHEGPWIKPAPDLSDCPNGFRLCLSHTPDNISWAQKNNIDLMLSGHVHGGQIRFPVFGSMVVPSTYGRRYDRGVFEEPPTVLHVTSGLGGKHPIRYRCPPEVVLLTLRSTPKEDS